VLYVANILAEYPDNDEDGVADNPKVMDALIRGNSLLTRQYCLRHPRYDISANIQNLKTIQKQLLLICGLTASVPMDSSEAQNTAIEKTAVSLRNSLLVSNLFILHNLPNTLYTAQLASAAAANHLCRCRTVVPMYMPQTAFFHTRPACNGASL